ncbi:MAG: PTS sugar transporter subunit IIB, partial [Cetobacterium sp.]
LIAIIAETPQDVLKLVEGGVPIKKVNIGNMHMAEGKKQISKAVCVDENDISTFKKLSELGIELEIQRVPTEGKENILELIK